MKTFVVSTANSMLVIQAAHCEVRGDILYFYPEQGDEFVAMLPVSQVIYCAEESALGNKPTKHS